MTKIMKLYQKLDVPKLKTRQTSPEEQEQEQDRTVHVGTCCLAAGKNVTSQRRP